MYKQTNKPQTPQQGVALATHQGPAGPWTPGSLSILKMFVHDQCYDYRYAYCVHNLVLW